MHIRDVMSGNVRTCTVDDGLATAAAVMWDADCGCVPVVDGAGKLAGIVTDRDICMAAYTQGRPLGELPVVLAMASDPVSVVEDGSIDDALECLKEHSVRRLPVVDHENHVVGILSMADLVRCCSSQKRGKKHISGQAIAETLGSICRSR